MRKTTKQASLLLLLLPLVACGSEPGVESPTAGETSQGFTQCGGITCQPGQYCVDPMFDNCEPGCTSDVNCAANQSCEDPDFFNIGTCLNIGPVCGNGTCEAGETTASCASDCAAGPVCGNGTCEAGETAASCASDCATGPVCGNAVCEAGESLQNCPADCVTLTDACKEDCFSYDFFDCMAPGELQLCYNSCEAASDSQITQFLNCDGAVFCDDSCFSYLP